FEVIRRLADNQRFGARAKGEVHLGVHQVEIEVQARVQVIVQPGEEEVINPLVEEVPVERGDAIARVDDGKTDQTRQVPRQIVEERERKELETVLRGKGDRLVKAMERWAVQSEDRLGVRQAFVSQAGGPRLVQ